MTLKVISAEKILFEGDVRAVTLPGALGSFTVLRNHASLISTLVSGVITYRPAESPEAHDAEIAVAGGVVNVDNNVVSVCVY